MPRLWKITTAAALAVALAACKTHGQTTTITKPAIKQTNCIATYITSTGGPVTITAAGEIHVADFTFTNSGTVTLKPGSYVLRVNNGKAPSITVSGAAVSNTNTAANALAASDSYIANYRRGDAIVGGYTPGQQVTVSQNRVGFDFGGVLHSGEYNNSTATKELFANFNATVPGDDAMFINTEKVQGKPTMGTANAIADLGAAHGMPVREHNLVWDDSNHWPGWFGSYVSNQNAAKINAALAARVGYYIEPGRFSETDVLNEMWQHSGKTVESAIGWPGIIALYTAAHKAAAGQTQIGMNQFSGMQYAGDSDNYVNYVRQLNGTSAGRLVDTMGIQLYVDSSYSLATSMALLQNLDTTNLPSFLSEFGVQSSVSVSKSPDILNNLVRVMFGNPLTTGFYNWYWRPENGAFAPNSYFYDSKGNLTAAGKAWQALMTQYTTPTMTLTADATGSIHLIGYYGDYTVGGKAFTFAKPAPLAIARPTPEPSTLTMLLIAILIVAFTIYRQRR